MRGASVSENRVFGREQRALTCQVFCVKPSQRHQGHQASLLAAPPLCCCPLSGGSFCWALHLSNLTMAPNPGPFSISLPNVPISASQRSETGVSHRAYLRCRPPAHVFGAHGLSGPLVVISQTLLSLLQAEGTLWPEPLIYLGNDTSQLCSSALCWGGRVNTGLLVLSCSQV